MAKSVVTRRPDVPALGAWLREALGALLLALAGATILALFSFTPADPSFDHATAGPAANLLGRVGAYVSELLLQFFGLAAGALAILAGVWGWRLISGRSFAWVWLRVALLPAALLSLSVALAALPSPASWPFRAGLGGVVGFVGLGQSVQFTQGLGWGVEAFIIGGAGAVLAAVLFAAVSGISTGEWRALGSALLRAAQTARRFLWRIGDWLARFDSKRAEARERAQPHFDAGGRARAARPREIVAPAKSARQKPTRQGTLDLVQGDRYQLPPLDLLEEPPGNPRSEKVDEEALTANARLLESVLDDFGVLGEIVKVRPGPVVTLYELEPAPGTKTSRVISLADDIARSMSAVAARVAVVPGRNAIGIELPNSARETVYLRELLSAQAYERTAAELALVLGKDIGGAAVIVDLARMPHLLVAGTTGSGKSVAINAMILSLLFRMPPDRCKLLLIDPKMLELSVYEGIPHLIAPVVTEPGKAIVALKWTVREMEGRYRAMSQLGVRNIAGYNARVAEAKAKGEVLTRKVQTGFDAETGAPVYEEQALDLEPLALVVVVVDEMADLMLVAGKEIEASVQRLSQMARAAGMHLIMATQRPSVDVITGTIKANFPTRISFQVTSRIDSRTILGDQGAEQLLGQGDMLYMAAGGRVTRVHGPLVRDDEVEGVVAFLKKQGQPTYIEAVTEDDGLSLGEGLGSGEGGDDMYSQAVALVAREGKASTSFIQRHFQIGYNRAARIIERMEQDGVVSRADRVGRREVLIRDASDLVS
jgi:S-DNA-T family DNA segregation ATPase FtsK/SpoIIIE